MKVESLIVILLLKMLLILGRPVYEENYPGVLPTRYYQRAYLPWLLNKRYNENQGLRNGYRSYELYHPWQLPTFRSYQKRGYRPYTV